jgi:hypothetical protein
VRIILTLVVLGVVAAPAIPLCAQGERATKAELAELEAWQAESPEAALFEGGGTANALWIGLGLLGILVIAIYHLFVDPNRIEPGS